PIPRTLAPVKVHVVDLAFAAVLVHQRERRAGDFRFARNAESGDDSLGQRGLAAAEFAFEQHQARRPKFGGQLPSQGQGLLGRVSYSLKVILWFQNKRFSVFSCQLSVFSQPSPRPEPEGGIA